MLDDIPPLGEDSRPDPARPQQSSDAILETASAQEALATETVDFADGSYRQLLSFAPPEGNTRRRSSERLHSPQASVLAGALTDDTANEAHDDVDCSISEDGFLHIDDLNPHTTKATAEVFLLLRKDRC